MRGFCLSTRERRGVCGIKYFVSKYHLENPCAIYGKQLLKWNSLLIFNFVVRRLLRNHLMNLMEHGLNLEICMDEYGLMFWYLVVNLSHGNLFPLILIPWLGT